MNDYLAFVEVARDILAERPEHAFAELGLDEILSDPDSPEAEFAGYAFLEAQGFSGATTSALSRVALNDPMIQDAFGDQAPLPLALPLDGTASDSWMAFGPPSNEVLVDIPERGLVRTSCSPAPDARSALISDDYAHVVQLNSTTESVLLPEPQMKSLRAALTARLRFGAAAEMLGACDRMLEDALIYTQARTQFGKTIASFQSMRDLLAWASTERHQLRELLTCCWSLQPLRSPDGGLAVVAKALAGTCSLRIAQLTLQATGAIAFTAPHDHSGHHRRILALNVVAGTSAELQREIGAAARQSGTVPSLFSLDQLATSLGDA
jgi:Acyl-CoA dehydrogenase, C-terminal domain